jgi:hypothetical protein
VRWRSLHSGAWALGACVLAAAPVSSCLVSQDGSPYLIDGGDLGACSGTEARAIPASSCPNVACCGQIAFALCLDGHYSDCSCTLLGGYTLVNASGQPTDASIDVGGECGASAEGGEGGGAEGGASEAGGSDAADAAVADATRDVHTEH